MNLYKFIKDKGGICMLKANIGWSTEADNFEAGRASAEKAVVDLVQTKVAFLYTSSDNDVKKVLEGAKEELGTAPIIGCTSSGGIIVPDGVVFKQDKAFANVRKDLVDNSLWGVISLPSGIFQPYAGVSTNILLLDKKIAKERDKILFVELKNDGFSLTTQRKPIDGNEIPELTELILKYKTDKSFVDEKLLLIPKEEISKNNYDLSINRYKKIEKELYEYETPEIIINRLFERNADYNNLLEKLRDL